MTRLAMPLILVLAVAGCAERLAEPGEPAVTARTVSEPVLEKGAWDVNQKVDKTEDEWKAQLTPEQYRIVRLKGTERPGTGKYLNNEDVGTYSCVACGLDLFRSNAKYHSGCGWPSFFEPLEGARVTETVDESLGMVRTEITCSRCGAHLGHIFNDGPKPTGLRYCVNSVSLDFESGADEKKPGPETD